MMDMPNAMQMGMSQMGMPMSPDKNPGDVPSNKNQTDDHQTCPFAAAPHVAAPLIAALLLPPSSLSHEHNKTVLTAAPLQASVYQPQSPRAPPTVA
jgi:hypothetical protein